MNTLTKPESTPVVSLESVTLHYGRRLAVVDVSLEVPAGSVYALLGRNGAGKTSLVRALLGDHKPSRGSARLLGYSPWRDRRRALAEVGVVPERPDAPPDLSLDRIAAFCRPLYERWDQHDWEERLERARIPHDRPFGSLSRGQKGLAQLALALAPKPRLLVLDDPTLGLDVAARKSFFEELIGDLHDRETTVFLTTHDLAGVERIADRVGILRQGRLLFSGSLEQLKARFRTVRFPGIPELEEAATAWSGLTLRRQRATPWGVEAVVEATPPHSIWPEDAEFAPLSLADLFLALTEESTGEDA